MPGIAFNSKTKIKMIKKKILQLTNMDGSSSLYYTSKINIFK